MNRFAAAGLLALFALCACALPRAAEGAMPAAIAETTAAPQHASFAPTSEQEPAPVLTTPPTVPPEPETRTARIGAVGDIALDAKLISVFSNAADDSYCLDMAYQGMRELIEGVDLMCGNLETPLAGEDAGYSGNPKTPNARDPKLNASSYAFNAPDELASDLGAAGFDFVSTANNHFGDRCHDGVLHTLDVLDGAGLLHAGTYRSEEEREAPCVTEVNGIRIGLLSSSSVFNRLYDIRLSRTPYLICSLNDRERIETDVRLCREAGAEFIIMFAHWDEEYQTRPSRTTEKKAAWLLSIGVDAIIGSHPHVVQPVRYVTVERETGPYTGLVAYSLGNSMMLMQRAPMYAQLFLQLTVQKDATGAVSLAEAAYMPVFSVQYAADGAEYFEVLPAWRDADRIRSIVPGHARVMDFAARAERIVTGICGTEIIPTMEELCSRN